MEPDAVVAGEPEQSPAFLKLFLAFGGWGLVESSPKPFVDHFDQDAVALVRAQGLLDCVQRRFARCGRCGIALHSRFPSSSGASLWPSLGVQPGRRPLILTVVRASGGARGGGV